MSTRVSNDSSARQENPLPIYDAPRITAEPAVTQQQNEQKRCAWWGDGPDFPCGAPATHLTTQRLPASAQGRHQESTDPRCAEHACCRGHGWDLVSVRELAAEPVPSLADAVAGLVPEGSDTERPPADDGAEALADVLRDVSRHLDAAVLSLENGVERLRERGFGTPVATCVAVSLAAMLRRVGDGVLEADFGPMAPEGSR